MASFIYSLDKSSKKFLCPSCGKKRFVRYINSSTNDFLNESDGRCDRETSCGYHKTPTKNEIITTIKPEIIIKTQNFIVPVLVTKSLKKYESNNLIKFLQKNFTEEDIQICIKKYKIGTSKHWEGSTVFWQINQNYKVSTGKIILFDENTGKRIKEPYPHIYWVHKKINQPYFNLNQCLFGMHLIKNNYAINEQKTIGLVESEKTALVMSIFLPNQIWLATGGKQNLKLELLQPLKNKNIVAFPDKGEFSDWNKKTIEFQKIGFKIQCSTLVENSSFEIGSDLADIYFAKNNCENTSKNEKIIYTKTELEIKKLSMINPFILSLIETFDLTDERGNVIRLY